MNTSLKVKELVCLCVGSSEVIPVDEIPTISKPDGLFGGNFRAFTTEAQDAVVLQHRASGDIIVINIASTEPEVVTDIERWAEVRCTNIR